MRDLSLQAFQSVFAENSSDVICMAIDVDHPSLAEPFRFVQDSDPLTYNSNLYNPLTFSVPLLPQRDSSTPTAALVVDNVTLAMIETLRSVTDDNLTVSIMVFRRPADTLELGPLTLTVSSFETPSISTLVLNLAMSKDYLNEQATKDRFNPSTAPGLF